MPDRIFYVGVHLLLVTLEVAAELNSDYTRPEAAEVQGLHKPVVILVHIHREKVELTGHFVLLEVVVDVVCRHEGLAKTHWGIVRCIEEFLPRAVRTGPVGGASRRTVHEQTRPTAIHAEVRGVEDLWPTRSKLHKEGVRGAYGPEDLIQIPVLMVLTADAPLLDPIKFDDVGLLNRRLRDPAEFFPLLPFVLAVWGIECAGADHPHRFVNGRSTRVTMCRVGSCLE